MCPLLFAYDINRLWLSYTHLPQWSSVFGETGLGKQCRPRTNCLIKVNTPRPVGPKTLDCCSTMSMLLLMSMMFAEMMSFTFDFAILDLNQVKCKNSNHPCLFHCIYICRILRKMIPCGLLFKQLPWDPANVNAWKYIGGVIPILYPCKDCRIQSYQT